MKVGSLFSGVGGFDLAFERAGAKIAWQVEIDESCRKVLARHWPDVPRYRDIREMTGEQLGAVDVLVGGFPCQDLSVAGKRAGLAGERSGLFHEFARLIAQVRPRWVVLENVPGLLSSNGGRDMGTVLGRLGQLGYGWAYRVLDAQYFGLAQRRRRVFIVGCLGDSARAAQVLFEPESCGGNPPPSREAGQRVAASVRSGIARSGEPERGDVSLIAFIDAYACRRSSSPNQSPVKTDGLSDALDTTGPGAVAAYRKATRPHSADDAERWEEDGLTGTLNGWDERHNPPPHLVAHTLRAEADASEDGTGRGTPLVAVSGCATPKISHDLNGTLRAEREGYLAHGLAVRRLTSTECERLQGFPDGWTFGADSTRYRQLGNAVAVPCVGWIARRMVGLDV